MTRDSTRRLADPLRATTQLVMYSGRGGLPGGVLRTSLLVTTHPRHLWRGTGVSRRTHVPTPRPTTPVGAVERQS